MQHLTVVLAPFESEIMSHYLFILIPYVQLWGRWYLLRGMVVFG